MQISRYYRRNPVTGAIVTGSNGFSFYADSEGDQ